MRAEREDFQPRAGGRLFDELDHALADGGLVSQCGVEVVQQEDVERGGAGWRGGEVGEGVEGKVLLEDGRGGRGRGCVGAVLFEAVGLHGPAVFEEGKVGLLGGRGGLTFGVGDGDVDDGEGDAGLDGELRLGSGGRSGGRDGRSGRRSGGRLRERASEGLRPRRMQRMPMRGSRHGAGGAASFSVYRSSPGSGGGRGIAFV